jgi:hypothetical protein
VKLIDKVSLVLHIRDACQRISWSRANSSRRAQPPTSNRPLSSHEPRRFLLQLIPRGWTGPQVPLNNYWGNSLATSVAPRYSTLTTPHCSLTRARVSLDSCFTCAPAIEPDCKPYSISRAASEASSCICRAAVAAVYTYHISASTSTHIRAFPTRLLH